MPAHGAISCRPTSMTAASLQDPLVRVQVDRAQAEGMPEARDVPVSAATLLAQEQALERAALRFEALEVRSYSVFLGVAKYKLWSTLSALLLPVMDRAMYAEMKIRAQHGAFNRQKSSAES